MRPFHTYLDCPHCALRWYIAPGHWGSTPCCCQSWTDRRYPDLAIVLTHTRVFNKLRIPVNTRFGLVFPSLWGDLCVLHAHWRTSAHPGRGRPGGEIRIIYIYRERERELYIYIYIYMYMYLCVFFPFILVIKFVGRTSRGYTGGRSHRVFHPPSFCGACLNFSREKDSAISFPRRP